jgi:hypothetical protein
MENKKIQQLLAKIFKTLKIKGKDLCFKKGSCTIANLTNYVKMAVSKATENLLNGGASSDED